jgi:16S rRNA processing protein RimM
MTIQKASVDTETKIIVGQFGSVYGVRGWLHVNSFTDETANIINYPEWWIESQARWQQVFVDQFKFHDKDLVVKLKNCDDRDQARVYTNHFIAIPRDSLPPLPEDEFYWTDLVNLRVLNLQGLELGFVDHLLATGANDVFVVKGKHQYLLPYVDAVIKSIDIKQKILIVDWDVNTDSK